MTAKHCKHTNRPSDEQLAALESALKSIGDNLSAAGVHFALAVESSPGEVLTVGYVPDCACLTMRIVGVAMQNGATTTEAILATRDALTKALAPTQ